MNNVENEAIDIKKFEESQASQSLHQMTNQLEEKHQGKNYENLFTERRLNLTMSRVLRNRFTKKINQKNFRHQLT